DSGNDEDIVCITETDRSLEPLLRLAFLGQLAATDVDDVSASFDRVLDCPRQIELRHRSVPAEHRNAEPLAFRRNARNNASLLREDDTGDVRSVDGPLTGRRRGDDIHFHEVCRQKTRVTSIDGP